MRLPSINQKIFSGRYAMCLGATVALIVLTVAICLCMIDGRPNRLADMALGALLVIIKDTFHAYFNKNHKQDSSKPEVGSNEEDPTPVA